MHRDGPYKTATGLVGVLDFAKKLMILQCSNCGSRFQVDAEAVGVAGRRVRCGRCRHEWWARATPESAVTTPTSPSPVEAMQSLPLEANVPAPPEMPWRRRAHWVAWGLFVLVVAGIVAAAVWRERIVLSYPASRGVYVAFGVQPRDPADGISVVDIVSGSQVDAGTVMLVVEGRIENVAQGTRRVPPLLATLYDEGDREIMSWTFNVDEPVLEAGDSVAFRTAIRPPERNFARVTISARRDGR